ncbi:MAG: flagellar export protein FliJ [Thiomonas sp.]|jgi:flagellar FliJ protein
MSSNGTAGKQRLDTLQALYAQAEQASLAAGQAVGQQQERLRSAQAKLEQLQSYAAQYREQIAALGATGAPWSQVRDLRGFVDRIDAAIAAQRAELARQQQRLAEITAQWAAARQREKAFAVLIEQHQAQSRLVQKRSALKNLQDWALRRASQFLPSSQQRSDL